MRLSEAPHTPHLTHLQTLTTVLWKHPGPSCLPLSPEGPVITCQDFCRNPTHSWLRPLTHATHPPHGGYSEPLKTEGLAL